MVQPLRKTDLHFLIKLNIELPFDPAIPLLSMYTRKMKTDVYVMNVHMRIIHHSSKQEATQMSMD